MKKNGFRVIERPIPDRQARGVPDPRVLQLWLDDRAHPKPASNGIDEIRASMGWPNLDLSAGVTSETAEVAGRDGPIAVEVYRGPGAGKKPAVVYFHGGGFMGGSLKTVANPCRLLAERAGAVVVSVDYRLAPEHPFPAGLNDCFDVVKVLHDRAADWGIDAQRLSVAGDSAGGNLAAACCLLDRKEPLRRIHAQLLIYPTVDLRLEAEGHLDWSIADYEIEQHAEFIQASLEGLKGAGPFFQEVYLAGRDPADPLVSPITHSDPCDFPPTLVITAEYDFLRVEGEVFAKTLADSGVTVRCVRYRGMDHAFFDKLGLFPQAADAVDQMACFLSSLSLDSHARLEAQLAFLLEIDKLKLIERRNELSNASRRENTAEHSWHLVMFALTLAEHAAPGLELDRALRMCAVHDLVEIDAGDTFFWDDKGYETKAAREQAAADRLFGLLPPQQGAELRALWDEFEACQSPEALFSNAVDRLAPVLLNRHSGGRSWRENGVTATKARARMQVVGEASPALGRALEELYSAAIAAGYLQP